MKILTYPWEHTIVNDYYNQELFNSMQNELVSFAESMMVKIQNGSLKKDTIFKFCLINDEENPIWKCTYTNLLKLFPNTTRCIESRYLQEDDLRHFSFHREYDNELTLQTHISILYNNNHKEDINYIHYDQGSKVFTAVTYVAPKISKGTILYDANREYVTEVHWKENSTLIFPPKDLVTWHSYETIENQYRITVNQFLKK